MFNIKKEEFWKNDFKDCNLEGRCGNLEKLLEIAKVNLVDISEGYINDIFEASPKGKESEELVYKYMIEFAKCGLRVSEKFLIGRFKIPVAGMSRKKREELFKG